MNVRNAWGQVRRIPRRTFVLVAILVVAATALLVPKGEEQKDARPLFRLNEIRGGTTPPVLYLSGSFTEIWKPAPGSRAPRRGEFEMYIRGTNYYFLKCWHGNPTNRPGPVVEMARQFLPFVGRSYSGWSQVEVCVDDFQWRQERRWGRFGSQGGGGGGDGGANWLAPGRRLWNSSGFIGALEEGQVNKEWYATETLRHIKKVGAFAIPRVIEFDRGGCSQSFRISQCEFRNEPGPDWFLARKKEYFRGGEERPRGAETNSLSAR
jgi:hypothetical protein